MRRLVVFNYHSMFIGYLKMALDGYNKLYPGKAIRYDVYNSRDFMFESQAGQADLIIHSGGYGRPVIEDSQNSPKLYICHSHQWKAKAGGSPIIRLKDYIIGVHNVSVIEDDPILGGRGSLNIMKHHVWAITQPPENAQVIAKSTGIDMDGREVEIIEALHYPDGSISVQGHPEEGTAVHIVYNFLNKAGAGKVLEPVFTGLRTGAAGT